MKISFIERGAAGSAMSDRGFAAYSLNALDGFRLRADRADPEYRTSATVMWGRGVWALPTVLLLEAGLLAGAGLLTGTGWPASVGVLPVVRGHGRSEYGSAPHGWVRLGVTFLAGTLVSLGQGRCVAAMLKQAAPAGRFQQTSVSLGLPVTASQPVPWFRRPGSASA
jgi:hypothetical protein